MEQPAEQKEDLRVQKTLDALIKAFQELIVEKPFEKITVRELCSRAKTRTATFYSHFSDKYDFFAFLMRRIRQQSLDKGMHIAAEMEPEDYISHVVRSTFDFLIQNESFLCAINANSILAPTIHLISHEIELQTQQHFKIIEARGKALITDPELLSELFIGAVFQASRWWFANRKELSREELTEKLLDILPKMLFR